MNLIDCLRMENSSLYPIHHQLTLYQSKFSLALAPISLKLAYAEHVRQPDNIVLVTHIASKLIMFFPEANFMHQLTHTWCEIFTYSLINGCLQRKLFSGKMSTLIRTMTRYRGVSIIALCGKHDSALICHLYSHILSIFDPHWNFFVLCNAFSWKFYIKYMTACFVMMLSLWVSYLGDIINKRNQRE